MLDLHVYPRDAHISIYVCVTPPDRTKKMGLEFRRHADP